MCLVVQVGCLLEAADLKTDGELVVPQFLAHAEVAVVPFLESFRCCCCSHDSLDLKDLVESALRLKHG